MTEFDCLIENLEYAVDVLSEYVRELKKSQSNRVFQLGKVCAAFEEVQIHYQTVSEEVLSEEESNSGTLKISSINANERIGFYDTMISSGSGNDYIAKSATNLEGTTLKLSY